MTKLSVNINKIATLRNSRGGNIPNLVEACQRIQDYGADGITIHPRPDERHITKQDVFDLVPYIKTEFNIEGYPSRDFLYLMYEVNPHQITLVPDLPEAKTSNAGWKTFIPEVRDQLIETIQFLKQNTSSRISLFIDPFDYQNYPIDSIVDTGTDRVELYTEAYAKSYLTPNRETITNIYKEIAYKIFNKDLNINAGHDLSLENLHYFLTSIPIIEEVSIGHALISEALYLGLKNTIKNYKEIINAKTNECENSITLPIQY